VKLLVDTHAFLWYMAADERLSRTAVRAIDASQEWWLSAASVWELAIKSGLGRVSLPAPIAEYLAAKVRDGLRVLSIDWPHAAAVERLPFHHRDPFDRLIVAQAHADRLPVVTKDKIFRKYDVEVIW
jgi:PIN domain nuclease of toxin-antitoxin system